MLAHTHGVKSYSGISGFSLLSNTSASYTGASTSCNLILY